MVNNEEIPVETPVKNKYNKEGELRPLPNMGAITRDISPRGFVSLGELFTCIFLNLSHCIEFRFPCQYNRTNTKIIMCFVLFKRWGKANGRQANNKREDPA